MKYQEKTNYNSFLRFCKTLDLNNDPTLIKNYKKIHSKENIWPEVAQGMHEVGILDMEIYLLGNRLFMIMDTVPDFDHDKAMKELASKPRQQEWETFVAQYQKTSSTATAEEKWTLMERIYKMDY